MSKIEILKGNIIHAPVFGALEVLADGYIVLKDGVIEGLFRELPEEFSAGDVTDYADKLIVPSFSDMHLHAPQYPQLGMGLDLQLLEWLQKYTFVTEARFSDTEYAKRVYSKLAGNLVMNGTTRVSAYSSLHREATLVLMDELEKSGITGYVGKVNMDRNSPDNLRETTEESLRETRIWIEESLKRFKNIKPIITPRFTPSCSNKLMEGLGKLAAEYGLPVQSHLSENVDEVNWVKELHPDCEEYWQTYDKYGLFGSRTLMGHCVYSSKTERAAMKRNGVWVVHNPDSNINIASGVASVRIMLNEGLNVVLGSDIAGGASLSMMRIITGAIKTSKRNWLLTDKKEPFLTVAEAFYLATSAGARYFGVGPGFAKGDKLHALVLDDSAFPETLHSDPAQRLERILYMGDDRQIKERYSEGVRLQAEECGCKSAL
ncbi:MAG: Guanine deaminase [Firmicutes bacterium ADurb.Bin182]|nr:MAG: Guanine deaminase [Firmicutes bacterium ADurb.Bin182]